jgi:hypothetical protein
MQIAAIPKMINVPIPIRSKIFMTMRKFTPRMRSSLQRISVKPAHCNLYPLFATPKTQRNQMTIDRSFSILRLAPLLRFAILQTE